MAKSKATTAAWADFSAKGTKTVAFQRKSNAWNDKHVITAKVSLLIAKAFDLDDEEDAQPPKTAALAPLPDCNRGIKSVLSNHANPGSKPALVKRDATFGDDA